MLVFYFSSLLALCSTFVFSSKKLSVASVFFCLLAPCLMSMFRYEYGNDYASYFNIFEAVGSEGIYDPSYVMREEFGWLALNYYAIPFGFFFLVGVLSIFSTYCYSLFIATFAPTKIVLFAIFLYLFNPDCFLVQLSAMRQSLAISFGLIALVCIARRRYIAGIAILFFASIFHATALYLLISIPASFVKIRKPIYFVAIALVGYVFVYLYNSQIIIAVYRAYSFMVGFDSDRLDWYINEKGVLGSGLFLLVIGSYLVVLLSFLERYNEKEKFIVLTVAFGLLIYPLQIELQILSRIFIYTSVLNIVAFPIFLSHVKSHISKILLSLFVIFFTAYLNLQFFQSDIWAQHYQSYKSIFMVLL